MAHDFDVIVVGAGPAGSAAALALARDGASVLVIERAEQAGAKNTSGGRIYTYALEELREGLTAQAPLERPVVREDLMLLDGDRAVTVGTADPAFVEGVPQSWTVLRADFDAWLAEQAEEAGATVVTGIRVDDLVRVEGRVQGVVAGGDEMTADLVVAADGVNSLLGQKAGLLGEWRPDQVGIGAKEVVALAPDVIEGRFGLAPGQGCARLLMGVGGGLPGGGAFLYTNSESVSLGVVYLASAVAAGDVAVPDILASVRAHPAIAPLLVGGRTVEYSAHLVPEGGWSAAPAAPYGPGMLLVGDAAGLAINLGYTVRGMDLAVLSGLAAARAVARAGAADDGVGPAYVQELESLGVRAAMHRARRMPAVIENERMFRAYPGLVADILGGLFTIRDATPTPLKGLVGTVRKRVPLHTALRDVVGIYRAVR